MSEKLIQLNLPAFALLHDVQLKGRIVVLHVRSASVVEILRLEDTLYLEPHVLRHCFDQISSSGHVERRVAVLHYSAILDPETDSERIMKAILIPTCNYYLEHVAGVNNTIHEET